MKKISLEQLLEESGLENYPDQYRYVCSKIQEHKLLPVKSSSLNGKKPALHLSYWLVEEAPDDQEQEEELKFQMSPMIRTDYYLKHPEVFRREAKWVRLLNRFFLGPGYGELLPVSLNERSFQIWGREKFLQREQGRKILTHCGVELGQLCVYDTTEPLAYYSCHKEVPQAVLILENKDTFYSMRRHLAEGARQMFGMPVGTVIYGAGKGILRSFEDFRFCVEPHINAPENQLLYFGDLDYEGIGIYEHLAELFSSPGEDGGKIPEIRPFLQAYEKMLDKARQCGMDFLPETSENQNRKLSGRFFQYFAPERIRDMEQILDAGKYIPQEIINRTDF